MPDEARSTYHCADGSPFPVRWPEAADAALPWTRERDHYPLVATPLEIAVHELSLAARRRAFEEQGLLLPQIFRRYLYPQGFAYEAPWETADADYQAQALAGLIERSGGVHALWEGVLLPRVRAGCRRLQREDGARTIAGLADEWGHAFNLTQVALEALMSVLRPFQQLCREELGDGGDVIALELMQGFPNATLAADEALWWLARIARSRPAVGQRLHRGGSVAPEDLEHVEGGPAFLTALRSFLDEYGWRSAHWQLVAPTWRERPELALAYVRRLLDDADAAPDGALREANSRREALLVATLERLPASRRDAFSELYREAGCYDVVRESRAHWQLVGDGSLRHALLRRGARLAATGGIDAAEDVFFLLPDEIESKPAARGGDSLRDRVRERRQEHAFWSTKQPPDTIGAVPLEGGTVETPPDQSLIYGSAASRGVYTGRARVIHAADEGVRLQRGEVLVCETASPSWTPLFAIAGAVVTDGGSALGHAAVTAREYGVPCVVATRVATRLIRDGTLVTVDGGAGTVTRRE